MLTRERQSSSACRTAERNFTAVFGSMTFVFCKEMRGHLDFRTQGEALLDIESVMRNGKYSG